MKLPLIIPATVITVSLALPFSSRAADKKEKTDAPVTEKSPAASDSQKHEMAQTLPFKGKVASVDKTAKTFTTKNKDGKENVFTVTDTTKIEKADGTAATFADIKVDEKVRGSRVKKGEGKWEVTKVTLGENEASAKKPAKEMEKASETKAAEKK